MFELIARLIPSWALPAITIAGIWFIAAYLIVAPALFYRTGGTDKIIKTNEIQTCYLEQTYSDSAYKWDYTFHIATLGLIRKPSVRRVQKLNEKARRNQEC